MHKAYTDNVHKYYTDYIGPKPLLYIMYLLIKHFVIYYNIDIFSTNE